MTINNTFSRARASLTAARAAIKAKLTTARVVASDETTTRVNDATQWQWVFISDKANENNKPAFFAKTLYKARGRIEQAFGRLKRFKRVALRCEKTAQNFASIVSFAAGLCLIKFVHTD